VTGGIVASHFTRCDVVRIFIIYPRSCCALYSWIYVYHHTKRTCSIFSSQLL